MTFVQNPRVRDLNVAAKRKTNYLGYFISAQLDGGGNFIQWLQNTVTHHTSGAFPPQKRQIMRDELHHRTNGRFLTGGDMKSLKLECLYDPSGVYGSSTYINKTSTGKTNRKYVGGFTAPSDSMFGLDSDFITPTSTFSLTSPLIPSMGSYGDKAWSRTKPKLGESQFFNFAAELREWPMQLKTTAEGFHYAWKSIAGDSRYYTRGYSRSERIANELKHAMGPREAAEQFLNVAYGWLPFIGDLQKLANVVGYWHNYVVKYTKYNGVPVRKAVSLFDDTQITQLSHVDNPVSGISYPMPCFPVSWPADFFVSPPSWTLEQIETTHVSGVGNFTYYRPEFDVSTSYFDTDWARINRFLTISGARITPSYLYNAMPWTWLVDWFSNLGDWVEFIGDVWQDSLVCHYCYATQRRRRLRTFTNTLPLHSNTVSLRFARLLDAKERKSNTSPFGFSLSWDGLSARQYGILSALGITRSRR